MHLAYVLAPYGGPEVYLKLLIPYLLDQGHSATVVYAQKKSNLKIFPAEVAVYEAGAPFWGYRLGRVIGGYRAWAKRWNALESEWILYQLFKKIHRDCPIDLIETMEGGYGCFLGRSWPVVLRAHGSEWTFRHFCQDGNRSEDARLIQMETQQLRNASAVSALSRHLAEHLSEICQFPTEKIHVIPYPIDINKFHPLSLPTDGKSTFRIMSVGRLEKRKGTLVAIEAMEKIWCQYPSTELYLFGKQSEYSHEYLRAKIPAEKQKQIFFEGFVSNDKLPDYYRRMTVYVAPSEYETLGNTILEAMASGLPIVASNVGAIPELIEENISGVLIRSNDSQSLANAIIELFKDQDLRKRFGEKSREKIVQKFTLDRVGISMMNLYENAIRTFNHGGR